MDWLPCIKRRTIDLYNKDGSKGEIHRCAHLSCSQHGQDVSPENCAECPLRIEQDFRSISNNERMVARRDFQQPKILRDGTMIYPKTGWEPPKCPDGYEPKSANPRDPNAWVFIPKWPKCLDRKMINTVENCGCIQINSLCTSKDSEFNGQLVVLKMCEDCPVKRSE